MADHVQGFISGGTTTLPNSEQVLAVHCVCLPGQLRHVVAAASASGSSDTILDVRTNGTSVWTNPLNRPVLPAGKTGVFSTYPPNSRALNRGDIVTLVVVQAGGRYPVAITAVIEDP